MRLFLGRRESGKANKVEAAPTTTKHKPTKPTNPCIQSLWRAHQWAVRALANAKLAPSSRTNRGLAVFTSLCASFLDAGRTSHRKQFFIIQALPCPFHSEGSQPTVLDGGSQPFALAGPISTFGLDWGYQCPTPNRYPCFFPRKPSAFHYHVSTCQPTIGASFQPTALNRPRTQPTNFTLSHKSVLVKFSFSRTQPPHTLSGGSRFSNAACFASERRKRFLQSEQTLCGSFLTAGRFSHSKGLVYFLSQALPRPLHSKASNPSAATDIPIAPTLPTISNRTTSRNMVSNVISPQSDTVPQRKSFSLRYLVSPCRRSDVTQASTQSTSPPSHPTAHSTLANAPHAACHLPSPAPNHPPFVEVGVLRT